jgi:hypothetical protein
MDGTHPLAYEGELFGVFFLPTRLGKEPKWLIYNNRLNKMMVKIDLGVGVISAKGGIDGKMGDGQSAYL